MTFKVIYAAACAVISLNIAAVNTAYAQKTININIDTSPAGIIRNDISPLTFGSGLGFESSQLRWTMDKLGDATSLTANKSNYSEPLKTPIQNFKNDG
jgi:hypothetical protein